MARSPSLNQVARRLAAVLDRETALARTGAVAELAAVAYAKREAFEAFRQACAARDPARGTTNTERDSLHRVLTAATENALVLEAVRVTLEDMAAKLRTVLRSVADPGTYGLTQRRNRHVLSAHVDASA